MTAHIHAALMLQYAQDAQETDKPWERWECRLAGCGGSFEPLCDVNPNWVTALEYRRKQPATKTVVFECWASHGYLHWVAPKKIEDVTVWTRIPALDKTAEVPV